MHLVEAPGTGALPPVVLLHGFTAAGAHYAPLLERLRRTSRLVVAPDLPAHGFSDAPATLDLDSLYLGLRDALDRAVDGPFTLVGNSLGGALAVRYALDRPQRVLGLALLSPGGAPMTALELAALKQLFTLRSDRDALAFVDRVMVRPGAMRRLYAYGIRGGFGRPAMRALLAGMSTADCLRPDELGALAMPVRVMWGEHERVLPASGRAFFEAHLPAHGRVELHQGVGHCPHLDDCDHTARTMAAGGASSATGRTPRRADTGDFSAAFADAPALPNRRPREVSIWWWALGYFAAYAPYSALTKALSDGRLGAPVRGNTILPLSTFASLLAMLAFLAATGWWRSAGRRQVGPWSLPFPSRWTALSGLCGATILTTTTLAYTISGVSIVFMMLLLRGGMLAMAPLVDRLSGRAVQWISWVATALTLSSLLVALVGRGESFTLPLVAVADVTAYLIAYFIRLRFMSKLAKSDSVEVTRRYFVEEQLVSTPAALLALAVLAWVGGGAFDDIRRGFVALPLTAQAPWAVAIGVLSQGTGIFGALVLLDKRENSFSVPVNRASSLLAGVAATLALWALGAGRPLDWRESVGAALVVSAIGVLSAPSWWKRLRPA